MQISMTQEPSATCTVRVLTTDSQGQRLPYNQWELCQQPAQGYRDEGDTVTCYYHRAAWDQPLVRVWRP